MVLSSKVLAIRPFTLVEDGYSEAVGQLELENTVEADFSPRSDSRAKSFGVEHELEYGLLENFTLRLKGSYVYEDSSQREGLRFDSFGVEGQLFFSNPNLDPVGLSVIAAVEAGEGSLTLNTIFVAQKDFDKWVVAYNFGLETSIDNVFRGAGQATATSGTLTNAFALAYVPQPGLKVGGELSLDLGYDNWSKHTDTALYAGPVINWIPNPDWWFTAGVDFLVNNTPDAPRWRAIIVIGYYF
jgi:hypothetical protein